MPRFGVPSHPFPRWTASGPNAAHPHALGDFAHVVSFCFPFRAALEGFPYMLQLVGESTKLNSLSHPQLEAEEATFQTSHRRCPSRHGAVGGTPCCRSLMDKETRQAWSREIACRMVKPLKAELALVVLCW